MQQKTSSLKAEKVPPIKIINVINKIRSGVGKFYQKLVPPQIAMFEMISNMWVAQAISVAAELGVADILKDGEMHFNDIAKKVNAHPESLYRLLRGLTVNDIFSEPSEGYFKLTSYGRCLRSDVSESVRSMAIFQGQYQWAHWGKLLDSVKTGAPTVENVRGVPFFEFIQKNPHAQEQIEPAAEVCFAGRLLVCR